MILYDVIMEDFVNYKVPSTLVAFPYCSMKCNKEQGKKVCHNSTLNHLEALDISADEIVEMYLRNSISKALVLQGMEPLDSPADLRELLITFRKATKDPIVIYTGYYEHEGAVQSLISFLVAYNIDNVIMKFGRFIPDKPTVFDEVLGVNLASDNQYGKVIN